MKKTIITLLLFFYWLAPNFGQTDTTRLHQMFTLNFLPFGAGIVGEFPLTRKSTIRAEIGGVFTFSPSQLSFTNVKLGVGFSPYGSLSYRYFHHLVKNTENRKYFYNSGNFIFAQVLHYASPLYKNEYFSFDSRTSAGIGYGLQRILSNRFVFSIGVGFGYYLPQKEVFFIGDLTLGILLKPEKE